MASTRGHAPPALAGPLARAVLAGEAVVAGVLSGTSADGIDVALVRFEPTGSGALGRPRLLAFRTVPFERALASRLRAVLDGEPTDLAAAALLHRDLGRAFGAAAAGVARGAELELGLLGSHGQTVYHHDGVEPSGPATLQLGDGDFAAQAAGCAAASDFRQRDVALGGEGAPLSALADDALFPARPRPLWILNLGGFANLTLLPAPGEPLLSFDVGPCGSLLDGLARRLLGSAYDRGGACAAQGRPRPELLARWLDHPFLRMGGARGRSTGRDTFGAAWVEDRVREAARAGGAPVPAPGGPFAPPTAGPPRSAPAEAPSHGGGR